MAVFVPPQRRAPSRRPAAAPLVIDVHPGFPAPPRPRPSAARTLVKPAEKRSTRGFILAGALLLTALVAVVAFRAPIVSAVPQINGVFAAIGLPVNLLGIEMHDVNASRVWEGGWEQLRVTGVLVNVTDQPVAVPAIQLTIVDASGAVIGQWQQAVLEGELAPGSTLPFTTDFPEPPAEAARISVRFGDGTAEPVVAPVPDIAVRFGDGTVQTTATPAPNTTTVHFGNARLQTIGVP
jgi:hypothetical protein